MPLSRVAHNSSAFEREQEAKTIGFSEISGIVWEIIAPMPYAEASPTRLNAGTDHNEGALWFVSLLVSNFQKLIGILFSISTGGFSLGEC